MKRSKTSGSVGAIFNLKIISGMGFFGYGSGSFFLKDEDFLLRWDI